MKKAVMIICLLLTPTILQADKYGDVNTGIRETLIALSQISIQGKDAAIFVQIQQGLARMSKDISDLGKEYAATQEEVMACKKEAEATPSPTEKGKE